MGVKIMFLIFISSMKLFKSKLTLIAFLSFSISACQADTPREKSSTEPIKTKISYLTSAQTKEIKLELIPDNGMCAVQLNNSNETKRLDIPHPCGFVHHKEKKAQNFFYKDIGHVFAIAGPIADEKSYTTDINVGYRHRCSTDGQAIIINNGKITLLKSKHDSLMYCHQLGFDEKDFYGFSHDMDQRK